jgi:dTDP-4-dehydrorhamnose 3,5-epimerase
MIFNKGKIEGAYVIDIEKLGDERGFFGRAFCQKEFEKRGLDQEMVQTNVSFSEQSGTLRGLHYQSRPYQEAKLIRCTQGSIYDVIADVRPSSSTFKQWMGIELTADNYRMVYVPKGCAHGFITLEDDSEALYQVSAFYAPKHEKGLRYNDPAFDIEWPIDVRVVSDKDRQWPDFEEASASV